MGDTIPAWLDAWSRFAASARLEDIDAATRARAKLTLADTLGAIPAGQQEPEIAALATRLAAQGGSGATSAVIATPHRLPASAAAFLNGVAGTALELDEGNRFARGHPCIHVLPAAIVAAERARATGGGFLLALCLGYELAARIGAANTLLVRPGGLVSCTNTDAPAAVDALCGGMGIEVRGLTQERERSTLIRITGTD